MNKKHFFIPLLLGALLMGGWAQGQTAMSSTTLSAALSATSTRVQVTSASGFAAGEIAVVDREAMVVTLVDTTSNYIEVRRGGEGTQTAAHASGATIYVEPPARFISDRNRYIGGTCTAGTELAYEPAIALPSGDRYKCVNSFVTRLNWELVTGIGAGVASDHIILFDGNAQDFYIGLDDSADDLIIGLGDDAGTTPFFGIDENGDITHSGTTPTYTLGDAGAEDAALIFDGNAQDFHIGLDDTADDLVIGLGSALGTTAAIAIDENLDITLGDATASDIDVTFDGNAQDYYIALDDGTDDLLIGLGAAVGTTPVLAIDENLDITFHDASASDFNLNFDGNAQDFHICLDDTADDLLIGFGTVCGTTAAIGIDENADVDILDATLGIGGIDYEFPPDDGDAGEQLQTDGAGVLTWESAASSRAVKTILDVATPDDALAKMLAVAVYRYRYKDEPGVMGTNDHENVYTGVMAEDFPEVMHHGDKILDPLSTFGYTVLAVQALQQQIEDLKAEISVMKEEQAKNRQFASVR